MIATPGWYRRFYERLLRWSASPAGVRVIGIVAFCESVFFPIPPDVLLISAVLARPKVWLRAATVCSLASLAGGAVGYLLGWGAWELVDQFFYRFVPGFSPEVYARISALYERWNFWIVFTAGFTPIPYKVFTVAAGVAQINFIVFLIASAISRSARFFLVAGSLHWFGPWIRPLMDRYLGWLTIAFTVALIGGFVLIKLALH